MLQAWVSVGTDEEQLWVFICLKRVFFSSLKYVTDLGGWHHIPPEAVR